jgi:inorganic pyrophosphatase
MDAFNAWHQLSLGENAPEVVRAVVEISRGSKAKYEIDKDSGMLLLDRVLTSSVHYPANYGFLPKTYCDDKDPLDVLIVCQEDIQPMALVDVKIVGVMKMTDDGEQDDKLIGVAVEDRQWRDVEDITDLPKHMVAEMKNFFETYKKLKGGEVEITDVLGKKEALQVLEDSIKLYNETF